ncbi:hypothetical protein [Brachybacterium tyrofermentans]|uniref:hypothetical protein n=1 Tax=Brachybacterium tyrofermentans TaxID=47848 RepID=UPI001867EA24|nr:hypothetical protein [Brachybacterium tyrofermentans]
MNHHTSTPTSAELPLPDFRTSEGLRELLTELNEHNAWATSPVAAELMLYATGRADRKSLAPRPRRRRLRGIPRDATTHHPARG